MRCLCLLLLLGMAAAAPMTPEKLNLIPGLLPDERRELGRKLQPLMGRDESVKATLVLAGVDEKVAARVEDLAPGPLLVERYAHGLVLEVPDLTDEQKALFDHLHPSVLAAQWSLFIHRRNLANDEGLKKDAPLRQRLLNSHDRQIREIEKRFWRIVGYALTVKQRAALHKWLPQPYQRPPNLQGHLYQLPGLTASQANRLRALLTEYESEVAADNVEIQRQRRRAAAGGLSVDERRAAQRAIEEATNRISEIVRGIVKRGREILSAEQMEHLDALPPLMSPGERRQNPGEIVKQMGLRPEQQERIQALGAQVRERVQKAQQRAREKVGDMQGEVGGESPQNMTMQMAGQNVNAELMLAQEEAAYTAVLQILEKRQVLGWIISPR